MIGNDIVDLNLAKTQSNWQRKGFLDKIFTKKELKLIKNTKDPFNMVWLLWSMKESAYKIYSRQHNVRFFAPKKFECKINTRQGQVTINDTIYFTISTITDNCIHTVARWNVTKRITTDFFGLKSDDYFTQSTTTYHFLKVAIANQLKIAVDRINIEKDANGVPYFKFFDEGNVTLSGVERSLSLSHHGCFGAYAFTCKVFKTL